MRAIWEFLLNNSMAIPPFVMLFFWFNKSFISGLAYQDEMQKLTVKEVSMVGHHYPRPVVSDWTCYYCRSQNYDGQNCHECGGPRRG